MLQALPHTHTLACAATGAQASERCVVVSTVALEAPPNAGLQQHDGTRNQCHSGSPRGICHHEREKKKQSKINGHFPTQGPGTEEGLGLWMEYPSHKSTTTSLYLLFPVSSLLRPGRCCRVTRIEGTGRLLEPSVQGRQAGQARRRTVAGRDDAELRHLGKWMDGQDSA